MKKAAILFLASAITTSPCLADSKEPVDLIVSASHLEIPKEKIGSSVTVITEEEIKDRRQTSVIELLRGIPGVDVVQSGGPGGNSVVFLRGANSEHTLVLIDGIEANNPISTNRAYNFSGLTTDNISRIEIVRGPQSMVYGSDAMGGVINIITKKGDGPTQISASIEGGSYNTFTQQAGVSGGSDELFYSLEGSHLITDGISSAARSDGNLEDDEYEQYGVSGRIGTEISQELSANATFRTNRGVSDLDQFGGIGGDDPNRVFDNRQLFTRGEIITSLVEKYINPTIGISYTRNRYTDLDAIDEAHPVDTLDSKYQGSMIKFDIKNPIILTDDVTLLLGADTEEEQGDSFYFSESSFGPFSSIFDEKTQRTNGYFAETALNLTEDFSVSSGIRVDDTDNFGSEVTWKVAPSLTLKPVRIFGSYGTGFKAPSLYQLYSEYGRIDLKPESNDGMDAGIESELLDTGLVLSAVYFHNTFDDLISFDPSTFLFENIANAKTEGGEFALEGNPSSNTTLRVSYTLLETEDEATGDELLRRARNKAGISGSWNVDDKLSLGANITYVGSRKDNDFSTFPATTTTLKSYTLVGLNAKYALTKTVEVFARIENAFDEEYQEVFGYGTLGAAAYGGVKVVF